MYNIYIYIYLFNNNNNNNNIYIYMHYQQITVYFQICIWWKYQKMVNKWWLI